MSVLWGCFGVGIDATNVSVWGSGVVPHHAWLCLAAYACSCLFPFVVCVFAYVGEWEAGCSAFLHTIHLHLTTQIVYSAMPNLYRFHVVFACHLGVLPIC